MSNYYRVMLGKGGMYLDQCLAENVIGVYGLARDVSGHLSEDYREFNREFIPQYQSENPDKTKIAAGLACGAIWTMGKGIQSGDVVFCPDGSGRYRIADVVGDYAYNPNFVLPHQRPVAWREQIIERSEMSEAFRNSTGSLVSVVNLEKYAAEIESVLTGAVLQPGIVATEEGVEDPVTFAMESHLEEFLVRNWSATAFGQDFDIYTEDGEVRGQQYPTDTGPLDILAVSKDGTRLLVVELKRGRASDVVVGQILRYMGYIQDAVAEPHQTVEGVIVASEPDERIRRALQMVPTVRFIRYEIDFRLVEG